jgi:hypothetical protein
VGFYRIGRREGVIPKARLREWARKAGVMEVSH